MQGLPFVLQIILLVLWYTVLPTMPVWLVFLPLIISGAVLTVFIVFFFGIISGAK